jgi:hypothetical protein
LTQHPCEALNLILSHIAANDGVRPGWGFMWDMAATVAPITFEADGVQPIVLLPIGDVEGSAASSSGSSKRLQPAGVEDGKTLLRCFLKQILPTIDRVCVVRNVWCPRRVQQMNPAQDIPSVPRSPQHNGTPSQTHSSGCRRAPRNDPQQQSSIFDLLRNSRHP